MKPIARPLFIALLASVALVGPGGASPATSANSCKKTKSTVALEFSKSKYPNIRKHTMKAIKKGWPSVVVLNRPGADDRRDRLLEDIPTKKGYDRDEYPPAVGRGKYKKALMKGSNPTGWKASVMYVPSSENRSHGSSMGAQLRSYCDGTRFRYRFN